MKNEYLKAIVWSRPPTDEVQVYRYIIVGVLVTDKPIRTLEGKNLNGISEFLIDGSTYGLSDLLDMARKGTPDLNLGDASSVLVGLGNVHIYEEQEQNKCYNCGDVVVWNTGCDGLCPKCGAEEI